MFNPIKLVLSAIGFCGVCVVVAVASTHLNKLVEMLQTIPQ